MGSVAVDSKGVETGFGGVLPREGQVGVLADAGAVGEVGCGLA